MRTSFLFAALVLFSFLTSSPDDSRAQVPGAIVSAGALGGFQTSSIAGISSGSYIAVRGAFSNFFGEVRHTDWGGTDAYVHENGILAGADMSLWHFMISGGVGVGSTTYQAPAVLSVTPPVATYTSLLYEAQVLYQIEIVSGIVTLGIGANYVGELSTNPINGWGAVGELSVGF